MEKPKCPKCGTGAYVIIGSYGEKIAAIIGGLIGGGAAITQSANTGMVVGAMIGSVVPVLGTSAGAGAGWLAGACTGFIFGAGLGGKVGAEIDKHIIRHYWCSKCGRTIIV